MKILWDQYYYYCHVTDETVEADTLPEFPELVYNSHDSNAASVAACETMFLTAMILYGFTLRKKHERLQASDVFYQLIYNSELAKTNNFIFHNP